MTERIDANARQTVACDAILARLTRECGDSPALYSPTQTLRGLPFLHEEPTLLPMKSLLDDGDLRVLRRLGRGGSGVVESAVQESLQRSVALKHVHYPDDPRSVKTLIHEAELTARLSHPSIVPIHRIFDDEHLGPVVVMGLLEGRSWRQVLDDPPAADHVGQSVLIAIELCKAMEYAHSQEVLHLDLKPDNVILGTYGGVFLIDWGVALDLRSDAPRTVIKGTPAYMAPEMVCPESGHLSPQTDVYLLAATLFDALFGRPPRSHPNLAQAMAAASTPIEIPDQQVPESLVTILRRGLAVDIEDRYGSARELREALEGFTAHRDADRLALSVQLDWHALSRREGQPDDYRQLVQRLDAVAEVWPDSAVAQVLNEAICNDWLSLSLQQDDLVSARNASARLQLARPENTDPLLAFEHRRVEWLLAEQGLSESHHTQRLVGHRRQAPLYRYGLALWCIVGSVVFLLRPGAGPNPLAVELGLSTGVLVIWLSVLLAFREALETEFGAKETLHTLTVVLVAHILNRGLGLWSDADPFVVGQVDLLLTTIVLASRVHIHPGFIVGTLLSFACFAVAAVVPNLSQTMLAVSPILLTGLGLYCINGGRGTR